MQSGRSGKTIPELEKTIALMKKVVEKVQRENESLKKTSEANVQEQLATLERDHEKLKVHFVKLLDDTLPFTSLGFNIFERSLAFDHKIVILF